MTAPLNRLGTLSLILSLAGIAGLALAKWLENEALMPYAFLLILFGCAGFALQTVFRREEYVSLGDEGIGAYLYGFQAVASGLSWLALTMMALIPLLVRLVLGAERLKAFIHGYPGFFLVLGGFWLASHSLGVIFGQALSNAGHYASSRMESGVMMLNGLAEKAISCILAVSGTAVAVWGGWSLAADKGPVELLLGLI